jgi:hypothetical protein
MQRIGVRSANNANDRREQMATQEGENALERGLHVLERLNDPELAAAYRQYMERIEALVGREHVDTYAAIYQRSQRQMSHQELGSPVSAEERVVREKVLADPEIPRLYDRYMALLAAHGLMDPALERGEVGTPQAE